MGKTGAANITSDRNSCRETMFLLYWQGRMQSPVAKWSWGVQTGCHWQSTHAPNITLTWQGQLKKSCWKVDVKVLQLTPNFYRRIKGWNSITAQKVSDENATSEQVFGHVILLWRQLKHLLSCGIQAKFSEVSQNSKSKALNRLFKKVKRETVVLSSQMRKSHQLTTHTEMWMTNRWKQKSTGTEILPKFGEIIPS